MSKPIFIVRFPSGANNEHISMAAESLNKMGVRKDYHCLVIKDNFTDGEIKFECYNAPHTEMEFKKLKERIITLLQNQTNKQNEKQKTQ